MIASKASTRELGVGPAPNLFKLCIYCSSSVFACRLTTASVVQLLLPILFSSPSPQFKDIIFHIHPNSNRMIHALVSVSFGLEV